MSHPLPPPEGGAAAEAAGAFGAARFAGLAGLVDVFGAARFAGLAGLVDVFGAARFAGLAGSGDGWIDGISGQTGLTVWNQRRIKE